MTVMGLNISPLLIIIIANLILSGITMAALKTAFFSPRTDGIKIRPENPRKMDPKKLSKSSIVNSTTSMVTIFGCTLGFESYMFTSAVPTLPQLIFEVVGVLMVYDFLYYFLHRYPFHEWKFLKRVHAIHHQARHPIAVDSLYLHPLENLLGLLLFMGCIAVFQGITLYSFAIIFFLYTQLNIIVHCGLALPVLGHMSKKHDIHHISMRGGNFASITPLPDLIFRTAQS